MKEALAVLRLELEKEGVDVVNSLVGWEESSRYVVAMHNLHSKLDGTGLSGREGLRNHVDQKNAVTAMFCSRILAETPDSANSIGRFVTAGYLYPVRNSFAHFVVAMIEGELKFFQAKSLKLVFPIVYPLALVGRFIRAVDSAGPALAVMDQEAVEIVPEDFARLPDKVSAIGIGSEAREQEKLCLTSSFQLLSPMILRWLCRHSHCQEFQAYLPECCLRGIVQVANQV